MILDDDKAIQAKLDHVAMNEANIRKQLMSYEYKLKYPVGKTVEVKLYFVVELDDQNGNRRPITLYTTTIVSEDQLDRLNFDSNSRPAHKLIKRYKELKNVKLNDEVFDEIYEEMKENFYNLVESNNKVYPEFNIDNIYVTGCQPYELT